MDDRIARLFFCCQGPSFALPSDPVQAFTNTQKCARLAALRALGGRPRRPHLLFICRWVKRESWYGGKRS